MKTKKLLTALLVGFISTSFGQVTYEATYTEGSGKIFHTIINLGNDNYKYLMVDSYNDEFSLYNLDHSPFMLNVPTGVSLDSGNYVIAYVSTELFDCDTSNIEYAIMCPNGMPSNVYIYRTDGTLIWEKDSVKGRYALGAFNNGSAMIKPIMNTPTGAKLILADLSTQPQNKYLVYGLCGTLPATIDEMSQYGNFVELYPNPSSNMISFKVSPPDNLKNYELLIFNSSMQIVKTEKINGARAIDIKGLSSGAYFYSLKTTDKVSQSGKFIITQ